MAERHTVLITGGDGQLAGALRDVFEDTYRVAAPGRGKMDVTDARAVTTYIDSLQPALVLHTAAYTDVDGCEENKPVAYQVNAVGSENVASACARAGVRLIAFSTDYVFDGTKKTPYTEDDEPNPINVYGRSKFEGELRILTIHREATIVRTGWLYDSRGKNFVTAILSQVKKGAKELRVVTDQVGNPTWVGSLAAQVRKLADSPMPGIVHATCAGEVNWAGFCEYMLQQLGIVIPVIGISSEELGRPAARPKFSALENGRLALAELDIMPSWQDSLTQCLATMKSTDVLK